MTVQRRTPSDEHPTEVFRQIWDAEPGDPDEYFSEAVSAEEPSRPAPRPPAAAPPAAAPAAPRPVEREGGDDWDWDLDEPEGTQYQREQPPSALREPAYPDEPGYLDDSDGRHLDEPERAGYLDEPGRRVAPRPHPRGAHDRPAEEPPTQEPPYQADPYPARQAHAYDAEPAHQSETYPTGPAYQADLYPSEPAYQEDASSEDPEPAGDNDQPRVEAEYATQVMDAVPDGPADHSAPSDATGTSAQPVAGGTSPFPAQPGSRGTSALDAPATSAQPDAEGTGALPRSNSRGTSGLPAQASEGEPGPGEADEKPTRSGPLRLPRRVPGRTTSGTDSGFGDQGERRGDVFPAPLRLPDLPPSLRGSAEAAADDQPAGGGIAEQLFGRQSGQAEQADTVIFDRVSRESFGTGAGPVDREPTDPADRADHSDRTDRSDHRDRADQSDHSDRSDRAEPTDDPTDHADPRPAVDRGKRSTSMAAATSAAVGTSAAAGVGATGVSGSVAGAASASGALGSASATRNIEETERERREKAALIETAAHPGPLVTDDDQADTDRDPDQADGGSDGATARRAEGTAASFGAPPPTADLAEPTTQLRLPDFAASEETALIEAAVDPDGPPGRKRTKSAARAGAADAKAAQQTEIIPAAVDDPTDRPKKRAKSKAKSKAKPDSAGSDAPPARRPVALVLVLLLVALAGAGGAFFCANQGRLAEEKNQAQNVAYLDPAATSEVKRQITRAVEAIYSYDYTRLDQSEQLALAFITGSYAQEFKEKFQPVRQYGVQQKAALVSKVVEIGVKSVSAQNAELLVMVNQVGRSGASPQPLKATMRLSVSAQRADGQWKVSGVKTR